MPKSVKNSVIGRPDPQIEDLLRDCRKQAESAQSASRRRKSPLAPKGAQQKVTEEADPGKHEDLPVWLL